MSAQAVSVETLSKLEPLGALSADSLRELSHLCYTEHVGRNNDPFRLQGMLGQAVYLVRGELKLGYPDASSAVIVGGTDAASFALGKSQPVFCEAKAITDVDLVRIDEDMLDIMLTWDQLAAPQAPAAGMPQPPAKADMDATDWRTMTGVFAAQNLTRGTFASLPPAHIETLFKRFQRIRAARGKEIIREGDEGDFYYVIENGRCIVTRLVGGARVELAELTAGAAFGEEALVSDARRNASVTMKTDGTLLRLSRQDFDELLREPLLQRVSRVEAEKKVTAGAVWLDVRYPAECSQDKLPGAINMPLNEVRNLFASLDKQKEYIVYCQTGRRSSAAAFLLSQRGCKAWLLEGGLRGAAS